MSHPRVSGRDGQDPRQGGRRVRSLAAALLVGAVMALPAAAQTGTITGTVVDGGNMQPVSAVQVSVPGTGLGTITNQNGGFTIPNAPVGTHTVRAERIGFAAAEQDVTVTADGTVEIEFSMTRQALGLDEIVVTGTAGAARRREIGNTISQLSADDIREPTQSMDALLQGRVAGMSVTQQSGNLGGGAAIRLRGNVSVSMSNQPLIYVDGVRMRSEGLARNAPPVGFSGRSSNDQSSPLNDINPNDIERIEVIKGAAATTLYGTEAAAGVIQIFTKRGSSGEARWTAQVDQGVTWIRPFGPDPSVRPESEPAQTVAGGTSDFLYINPWLKNAHTQNYSLSVTGGGEALQYFLSGAIQDNEGVLPNDQQEKLQIRGNFTFTPLAGLRFDVNAAFSRDDLQSTPAGNNAHGLTLNAFRRDRNYRGEETREAIDPILDYEINTKVNHLVTGFTATHTATANLTNRLTVGYDLIEQNNRNFRPFGFALASGGILSDQRAQFTTLTADYVGTYTLGLTDRIRSSLSWGAQSVTTEENETIAHGEDFPGPGRPTVSSAGARLGFEARQRVVNAGVFAQNVFDFADKYFITAGLRVDGNSAFGQDLGLEAYPKVSGTWVMSDEDFWNEDWGQLKLRSAWGQSGRAPGAFDAVRTFDPVGFGPDPAFFPQNVGNPELGPERTTEFEIGFDGAFFDQRLTLDFTHFRQTTTDALFFVRQIPSQGFLGSQLENVGELSNNGVELAGNFMAIDRANFGWDIGGSFSYFDSEVVSLGGSPEFSIGTGSNWIIEGEAAPTVRGDCIRNKDELDEPDLERNCVFGPNEPTHIIQGNTLLRLPYGITLSARGEYQGGHFISNGAEANAISRSVRWPGCFETYAIEETQGRSAVTAGERARCLDISDFQGSFSIVPSDFFKLRDVTAQIPVPEGWLPRTDQATLTLSGRNLARWTREEFNTMDPEIGFQGYSETSTRSISEHIPPPASFVVSLRIAF